MWNGHSSEYFTQKFSLEDLCVLLSHVKWPFLNNTNFFDKKYWLVQWISLSPFLVFYPTLNQLRAVSFRNKFIMCLLRFLCLFMLISLTVCLCVLCKFMIFMLISYLRVFCLFFNIIEFICKLIGMNFLNH